jgi:phosphatidylcholine synthase
LDDIVDYLNYTFIPVIFAYQFAVVGDPGWLVLPVVLISSAYGFSQESAKTEDGYFTGFPSYWNLVVFYLYLLSPPPGIAALVLGIFAVLVFAPVKYLTWKSPVLKRTTLILSMLWSVSLVGLLLWFEAVPRWAVWLSLLYPAYHLGISIYLTLRRSVKANDHSFKKEIA